MTKTNKISYAEALTEIEAIVGKIDNEEMNVDDLAENVEKVLKLVKLCKLKLRTTEESVSKLIDEIENNE